MTNLRPAYSNVQPRGVSRSPFDKRLLRDIGISAVMLALSYVLNFYSGIYATESISSPVTDIILDNIPVVNVDIIFVEGSLLFWIFIGVLLVARPERIPFVFKSLALFTLVRSGFIVLTHLGPYPTTSKIDANLILQSFTFGGDFFFSGHTGSPFLLGLMFWKDPKLRLIFLAASVLFGAAVLLGHLHYSIDVFAAFFISYGVHDLAKFLFRREYRLFDSAWGAPYWWTIIPARGGAAILPGSEAAHRMARQAVSRPGVVNGRTGGAV